MSAHFCVSRLPIAQPYSDWRLHISKEGSESYHPALKLRQGA
jgi:hypothetical protein